MAASPGLNFPADGRLAPEFGGFLYAHWERVVLKPEIDLNAWIATAHTVGLKVLGVVAKESLGIKSDDERWTMEQWLQSIADASGIPTSSQIDGDLTFDQAALLYSNRYGESLDGIQCGNESDHKSPSSWNLEPQDLNRLLVAFRAMFPNTTLVGPGLVSGQPGYLDSVSLDVLDAICIHPYGQRPNNAESWDELPGNFGTVDSLLDSYAYHGKRIWVTEVGVSTDQVSEAFQAHYCERIMQTLLSRADVDVAMWFCADDQMVSGFGLYGDHHNPKPSAAAYMRAAKAVPEPKEEPEPKPKEPIVDHEAVLNICLQDIWQAATIKPPSKAVEFNPDTALAKHWRDHIADMGPACGPERYTDSGHAYQGFVGGVWKWSPDNGVEKAA